MSRSRSFSDSLCGTLTASAVCAAAWQPLCELRGVRLTSPSGSVVAELGRLLVVDGGACQEENVLADLYLSSGRGHM